MAWAWALGSSRSRKLMPSRMSVRLTHRSATTFRWRVVIDSGLRRSRTRTARRREGFGGHAPTPGARPQPQPRVAAAHSAQGSHMPTRRRAEDQAAKPDYRARDMIFPKHRALGEYLGERAK